MNAQERDDLEWDSLAAMHKLAGLVDGRPRCPKCNLGMQPAGGTVAFENVGDKKHWRCWECGTGAIESIPDSKTYRRDTFDNWND